MDQPNLLFIFTDQQRFDTMGCYGNTLIRTPNLNRLAAQSVVFENAYVTQPVCTPSRASIMTGLYPHTCGCVANGVPLRPDTPTIAEMLSSDYRRAYIGKWHLGEELSAQHGFDEWVSIEDGYTDTAQRSDYHRFLLSRGFHPDAEHAGEPIFSRWNAARLGEPHTKASFLAQEAARFIGDNRHRPFALCVNFLEPHMPYTGPYDDLYDPDGLPVGPAFLVKPDESCSLYHRAFAEMYMNGEYEGHDFRTRAGWLKLRAQYWGLVTLVDNAVGRILDALHECGLDERTIVVFTSDHGDLMGDHGIMAKCVMYEGAVRVPLLVRVPGVRPRLIPGRLSQIDLVPTLLDLLGRPIPGHLQGESRAPVVRGERALEGVDVIIEWNGRDGIAATPGAREFLATLSEAEIARIDGQPWRTIITPDGWKLNLSRVDRCELYDLNTDPHELRNLFDLPEHRGRVRDLTARIAAWQETVGDAARGTRLMNQL